MLWFKERKRIGDYAAGTLVIKMRSSESGSASRGLEIVQAESSEVDVTSELPEEVLPYVATLSVEDYKVARYFLDRYQDLEDVVANPIASQIAVSLAGKLHSEAESIENPITFLKAVCSEWEHRKMNRP